MNKDYFIKLNRAIYKITETFFEKEPLKFKIREFANIILADLILFENFNSVRDTQARKIFSDEEYQLLSAGEYQQLTNKILNNIEILMAYFDLAESQNFVSPKNFLFFCREYSKIRKTIEQLQNQEKEQTTHPAYTTQPKVSTEIKTSNPKEKVSINDRQKKILQILEKKQEAQIKEIEKEFPEKSRRTLQRDLENLISKKLIQKKGKYNELYYEIKV